MAIEVHQTATTNVNLVSNRLQTSDRNKIYGWNEIQRPEIDQLEIPEKSLEPQVSEPTPTERLKKTQNLANEILDKINELTQKIDERCAKFKVSSEEKVGSPLFQSMVRIFNERTTTITYDHYKKALEYRQQIAEEDSAALRLE